MKKVLLTIITAIMVMSFPMKIMADEQLSSTYITLESGTIVTEEEFIDILNQVDLEVYKISNTQDNLNPLMRGAGITLSSAMTSMAGTWYIPGIGTIVVTAATIIIAGVAIYAATSWLANQVKNWITSRALIKQVDEALNNLGQVSSSRASHILNAKHKWNLVAPGGPKDPNRWKKIKEIMKKVLVEGTEVKIPNAFRSSLKYNGKVIEVTYNKINGRIYISNGWVK